MCLVRHISVNKLVAWAFGAALAVPTLAKTLAMTK